MTATAPKTPPTMHLVFAKGGQRRAKGFRIYIANNGQKLVVGLSISRPLLTQFVKYLVVFSSQEYKFHFIWSEIFW